MRVLLALVTVLLVSGAALFFAERPGTVTLVWQGWRVDTSVAVLVFVVTATALLLWFLFATLAWAIGAPRRAARRRRELRHLQGYRTLTQGLVAIAAGDAKGAERLRLQAERHFIKGRQAVPPLTKLLAAQSALLQGDHPTAHQAFNQMLESPETEFLGLRGLIVQALKQGDDATALSLVERANELRPATAWVLQSQLALETRSRSWRRAERTLAEAVKRRVITAEQGRRHRAALLLARSQDAVLDGDRREGSRAAAKAYALDQGFPPAAIAYADLLHLQGRSVRGLKVIETAWARGGHPALAAAYDRLLEGDPPNGRVRRFERLIDLRAGDADGHLAAASVALSAQLWGEARRHLEAAGAAGPGPWPQRLCHLMAELEEGQHQDAAAIRRWVDRIRVAPPDPAWVCNACGAETPQWHPLCPSCQTFDSLAWRTPDRAAGKGAERPAPAAESASILELGRALAIGRPAQTPASGEAAEGATRGGGA
jgi:HemY protein